MLENRHMADRILHGIDPDSLDVGERIRYAAVRAAIAAADEAHTANLLKLLGVLAELPDLPPIARVILGAQIRRRLGILPLAPHEATTPNGGE